MTRARSTFGAARTLGALMLAVVGVACAGNEGGASDGGEDSRPDQNSDHIPGTVTDAVSQPTDAAPEVISSAEFVTNRTATLDQSWPVRMKVYDVRHLSLDEVAVRLGVDQLPRTVVDASLNRYSYALPSATVEVAFDQGLAEPFHFVSYREQGNVPSIVWSSPTELAEKWQQAAGTAVSYLRRLTTLTPVVYAGTTDADLQESLTDGFAMALLIEGRGVFIDDLYAQVTETGLHEFHTDELPFEVTGSREVEVRSRAEVEAIVGGGKLLDLLGLGTILYAYRDQDHVLEPLVAIEDSDGRLGSIPLDRSRPPYQ